MRKTLFAALAAAALLSGGMLGNRADAMTLATPDLPPLKWSSLRYVLTMEDEIDGEEAAYGRRGCREASAG